MSEVEEENVEENMAEVEVDEEQAVEEDTPVADDDKAGTTIGGVTLDEVQLPLFIVLVASIILLIATDAEYNKKYRNGYERYAISISSISLGISAMSLLLHRFATALYEQVGKNLSILNFVWSFVGACFLTFYSPFQTTSNGYFAAWATMFGCAMSLGMDGNTFKSNVRGLGAVMGHAASSLVFLIACIVSVADGVKVYGSVRNYAIYGLSLACFSTVVVFVLLAMSQRSNSLSGVMNFGLWAALSIMWLVAACLVTFDGPFTKTGNGYFSAWAACVTAIYAAGAAKKEM